MEKYSQKIRIWLDDTRDPKHPDTMRIFGSRGDEVWIKTSQEAMEVLSQNQVEFISFDHDLGEESDHDANYVAIKIEEKAFYGMCNPIEWRIHSRNPVGSAVIKVAMESADRLWVRQKESL